MMGREVFFHEKEFELRFTGSLSIFALKSKLDIPYSMIKNVLVDNFDPPAWMLRMPGTAVPPLHIYEGSFEYANEWYFLSFEKKVPLVQIELEGHKKYKYVIFEIDNPKEIAAELRRKIRESENEE